MEAKADKEAARFDDALKAEVKALIAANYPSAGAALRAALKGKHRTPGNAERDAARHPVETLEFFGLKQTMHGRRAPGPARAGTPSCSRRCSRRRASSSSRRSIRTAPQELAQHALWPAREAHAREVTRSVRQGRCHRDRSRQPEARDRGQGRPRHRHSRGAQLAPATASSTPTSPRRSRRLKPGGVLGVEEHRAKPDANPDESAKQGYLPEAWVIQKVEVGGLQARRQVRGQRESEGHEGLPGRGLDPAADLPRSGTRTRARYAAIGESDRMTLKFVKPAR